MGNWKTSLHRSAPAPALPSGAGPDRKVPGHLVVLKMSSNTVGRLFLLSLLPSNPALYSLLQPQRGEGLRKALGVGPNPTSAVVPPWCCILGSKRATSMSHMHSLLDQPQPLAHMGQYKSRKTAGPEESSAVSYFPKAFEKY